MTITKPLTLALIDGNPLLTRSLSSLLSAYHFISSVHQYNNSFSFLDAIDNVRPDIVIADIMLKDISGIELLKRTKHMYPGVQFVFLTCVDDRQLIMDALYNGAMAYLNKDVTVEELAAALATIESGEVYIGKSIRENPRIQLPPRDKLPLNFSPMEKKLIANICRGMSLAEIAAFTGLSLNTVRIYYTTILRKLDFCDIDELTEYAVGNCLYETSPAW